MKEPDPILLERCQQGDSEAFAQLLAEQQDYVYTLARRLLRHPEEAADVTQEVFLKVWQGLPAFRGDARFRTWLYRIVTNHCLNRLRSLKGKPNTVSLDKMNTERIRDQVPGPYAKAWQREQQEMIWGKVEQLPEKYRAVLNLYYQQELSCREIAEVLGIPIGTVKTHLHRARTALANALPQGRNDVL